MNWQTIETAPKDGRPFFVYWPARQGCEPHIDQMADWDEYQEILSFGEPPATHWIRIDPPKAEPDTTLLPAIPGHSHVVRDDGILLCGCVWPKEG